jgi:hypothetical protein
MQPHPDCRLLNFCPCAMPSRMQAASCLASSGRHDDDEAFALARIQPFQLGCRRAASVRAAILMTNEARQGSQ